MRLVDAHRTTIQLYPGADQPTRAWDNDHHICRSDLVCQTLGIALLIIISLSLMGCEGKAQARSVAGSTTTGAAGTVVGSLDEADSRPCIGWPKNVALLFDQTESTCATRTEHPPVGSLNDAIDCAKHHGGSIYAGTIRDHSNQPFAHLLVEAEPTKPKEIELTGNPLIDTDHEAEHARVMDIYEKRYRAWLERTNAAIETFRRAAGPLLAQRANARATDLVTAVERAYVALSEPTPFPWLASAPRVLVVISDGECNVGRRQIPAAGFPLTVIAVNGDGRTGDLQHLHPILFQSFDSMLTYVTGGRHVV